MSKVIDLDSILSKTFQFKLHGELINVNQPPVSLVKKFGAMANVESEEEIFDKQAELVCEIMNNNTSSKKFTKTNILALPQEVLTIIITTITEGVTEAEENPN